MKTLFACTLLFLVTTLSSMAQRPWQEFSDPGIKILGDNFKSPPSEYGIILW